MKKLFVLLVCCFVGVSLSAACVEGNCQKGEGVFLFKDGSKYVGEFRKGRFNGYGVMEYSNGNLYKGTWMNQQRAGKGLLIFANGDRYKGQFKEGKFCGKGTYTYEDGDSYDGDWENHVAHGKGVYLFSDNERYEGSFENGVFSGVGAFHYNDGTIFIGNWKDNKKNGEGKMHYKTGEKIHGTWVDDELVERGLDKKKKTENSNPVKQTKKEEVGQSQTFWKNCTNTYCSEEQGELIYGDGSKWQGGFLAGEPNGEGTMYYIDGNRYEGEIGNHAPNGEGVMYFHGGTIVGGTWVDGYPVKRKHKYELQKENRIEVAVDQSDEIKIWAVIVGASSYAHMPTLRYTDDDAYQIYAFLKSPEGGALPNSQIKLLIDENATRQNILAGMNEVLLQADENDVVLMYYSGHGLPGMFLPIDFDGYRNSLSHSEVLEIFNASKAKHKICIADACHSGSLLASRSPFKQQLDGFYGEYKKTEGGTALIMSSKSEEVSLETSGLRQGIFSHYLVRGLNGEADFNSNKIVTVTELYQFIDKGVRDYTGNKQRPSIAGNYDVDMPVSTVR